MFDFDDTLADSTGVHERVWPAVVAALCRHVPDLDAAAFLERYEGCMEAHYERLMRGETDFAGFRRERLAVAIAPWADVGDDLFRDYQAVKARVIDDLRLHADAVATLRHVRAAGIRVGLLTNGPSELQRRKLAVTGIEAELDVVGISEELGAHKPAAAAFEAMLELLGCSADEAAMVGDSLANDVGGALAAGFARVVWISSAEAEPPAGAQRVRCLAEVPAVLGVGMGTAAIQDGQLVEVDGDAGTVRIIAE